MSVVFSLLLLFFAGVGCFDSVKFIVKKCKCISKANKKSEGVKKDASTNEQSIGL